MAKAELPSPELLRKLLRYEPETGMLFWLARSTEMFANDRIGRAWNTKWANKEAFTYVGAQGYPVGAVFGINYTAHRVIVAMQTGVWPVQVDHENHVRTDNRFTNLKPSDPLSNGKNQSRKKNNTSGICGVSKTRTGRWYAYITHDRKMQNLGTFTRKRDAVRVRRKAERCIGYHANHGR